MDRWNLSASHGLATVVFTLLLAAHCQASLLECANIPGVDRHFQGECALVETHRLVPALANLPLADNAPPPLLARTSFQVNVPQASSSLPDTLPIMVFFAGLLGVLLVRAKSCNSK